LQADINEANVQVSFYRSVGEFVKGNALESDALEQAVLVGYVAAAELNGIVKSELVQSTIRGGTIIDADVTQAELPDARRYRVEADSDYVEARWTGEARLKVSETQYKQSQMPLGFGMTSPLFSGEFVPPVANPGAGPFFAQQGFWGTAVPAQPWLFSARAASQ